MDRLFALLRLHISRKTVQPTMKNSRHQPAVKSIWDDNFPRLFTNCDHCPLHRSGSPSFPVTVPCLLLRSYKSLLLPALEGLLPMTSRCPPSGLVTPLASNLHHFIYPRLPMVAPTGSKSARSWRASVLNRRSPALPPRIFRQAPPPSRQNFPLRFFAPLPHPEASKSFLPRPAHQ